MTKRIFTRINNPDFSVVNNETGEIVSGVATIKCSGIDEFIMCFLSCIPEIVKLDGNTMRVLMWCWKFSTFSAGVPEANVIVTDKSFKDRMRKEGCDMTDSVIDKSIHTLYKKGFLERRCRGNYFLNPQYFFKGTLTDRSTLMLNLSQIPNSVNEDEYPVYGNVVNIR